jgi:hypothetical protein
MGVGVGSGVGVNVGAGEGESVSAGEGEGTVGCPPSACGLRSAVCGRQAANRRLRVRNRMRNRGKRNMENLHEIQIKTYIEIIPALCYTYFR